MQSHDGMLDMVCQVGVELDVIRAVLQESVPHLVGHVPVRRSGVELLCKARPALAAAAASSLRCEGYFYGLCLPTRGQLIMQACRILWTNESAAVCTDRWPVGPEITRMCS